MSNIRGLSDLKNTGGPSKGPGGPPMGGPGGFPGFPGGFGMGQPAKEDSKHIKHLRDGQLKSGKLNCLYAVLITKNYHLLEVNWLLWTLQHLGADLVKQSNRTSPS
jgi:hypothetical protein